MTQLEFCRDYDERPIARIEDGEPAIIPSIGDRVYVPDEQDSRVYLHIKVVGRQFYYDQQGHLATVRLSCEVL
jgi:hypothetical protein